MCDENLETCGLRGLVYNEELGLLIVLTTVVGLTLVVFIKSCSFLLLTILIIFQSFDIA